MFLVAVLPLARLTDLSVCGLRCGSQNTLYGPSCFGSGQACSLDPTDMNGENTGEASGRLHFRQPS